MGLDALEGDFAQEGEVLGGEALAGAGGIFQEGDIQMPVELVLDGPVSAHEQVEVSGRRVVLVADEPAGGMGLAVAVVDLGGDLDQGLDVRPAGRQGGVVEAGGGQDAAGAGLDAPVPGFHAGGRLGGLVQGEGLPDALQQAGLVLLDGQQVMGLLLADAAGDVRLGAHGVQGDHRPGQVELVQQPGQGR